MVKSPIRDIREIRGESFLKTHMPSSWIVLVIIQGSHPFLCNATIQVYPYLHGIIKYCLCPIDR